MLPFPSPGDLPDPQIEPGSLASPALAGGRLKNNDDILSRELHSQEDECSRVSLNILSS